MPITDLLPLIQAHAWVPLAALVIGFVARTLKDDAFVLPAGWSVAARWRPVLVVALGVVSGVLDAIVGGTPWRDALVGGLLSALLAMLGHTTIVDILRGGRDLGAAAPKPPLYQPPPPVASDEPTLPRGPRGVASIRSLVAVVIAGFALGLPLSGGCASQPMIIHAIDTADGVCPEVTIWIPELGPVCAALHTVDRLIEILAAARAEGKPVILSVDGRRVTIPVGRLEEVRAGLVGARASARRSAGDGGAP